MPSPIPILLDVDTGIDDALALLLAVRSPEVALLGVTTVAGNVDVGQTTRNTLAVLELAGAVHVPVARGAARPLLRRLTTATFFHGPNGLGGVELPPARRTPEPEPAALFLIRQVLARPGEVTLIATGPLTNVALALRLEPAFGPALRRLVVMGGAARVPGNVSPVAEANFYADPEAARIVFEAGLPLTMVGLDVTTRALFAAELYSRLAETRRRIPKRFDAVASFCLDILEFYLRADLAAGLSGSPLHDPLTVAGVIWPELLQLEPAFVTIATESAAARGQSVTNLSGVVELLTHGPEHDDVSGLTRVTPNCEVAVGVAADTFLERFCARLGLGE
jgi:inosine-uridine nucleoside N-ribohydrolase